MKRNKLKTKLTEQNYWNKIVTSQFSVLKAQEGGPGLWALIDLKINSIPCRKAPTVYVGHVGLEVPKKYEKKQERSYSEIKE